MQTVKEFIGSIEKLKDIKREDGTSLKDKMLDTAYIWDNNACTGYCLEAMEAVGIPDKARRIIADYLKTLYGTISMQEAEERGRKGI